MASIKPNSDNCLRCHEHNHGGDMYPANKAAMNLGYKNPRLLHPGAKRGTPTTGVDVHYRAGMNCIDCHETHRTLAIQFRHSEADWTRGIPEFVDLDKNEPLGFVNIAGRLFCKVVK